VLQPLREIPTEGGAVLHMLRSDSPLFRGFGEVYFSELRPGNVRAWKKHSEQTQHFSVPVGLMRIVLYDGREQSPTFGALAEVLLGRPGHYGLLRIPPGIWYGFAAQGDKPALIANCTDTPHCPEESERLPADSGRIPFRW
jgi:dTDP-4-dehydrorhamnose 3,5-epimerase